MKARKVWTGLLGLGLLLVLPAAASGSEPTVLEAQEPEIAAAAPTEPSSNAPLVDLPVLDQVYLESVNLSGMTTEEAGAAAQRRMEEISGYQITLHMDDESVGVSAGELGLSGDNEKMVEYAARIGQTGNVIKRYKAKKELEEESIQLPLIYQVDQEAARTALETYCVPLNREVSNYGLTRESGEFEVVNGQRGITLNEEESVQIVTEYLTNIWKDGSGSVELSVELTEPKGSREELEKVQDVLGTCSTDYSASSSARATNIKNGTSKLNGIVLYPGDSLSVCDQMVPFDEENGYEMAPSYSNGSVVESFGGGICQVSTTLYMAVLRSELEVTERYNHSMIVTYVKPSMDAAIAEGSKDLKFTNNLEAPIYIEGVAYAGTLVFTVYGQEYRPEGRTVTFESETLEEITPTTELVADTESALGAIQQTQSSHTGYVAKLWKVVTENGQETRTEVNNSNYQMTPNRYKVGVKTDNQEAAGAMYSAISTNDLNEVYKVLQQYS